MSMEIVNNNRDSYIKVSVSIPGICVISGNEYLHLSKKDTEIAIQMLSEALHILSDYEQKTDEFGNHYMQRVKA